MKTEIINKMGTTGVKFELCIFELQALANLNRDIKDEINEMSEKFIKMRNFEKLITNLNKIINFNNRITKDTPTTKEVEYGLFSPIIKENITEETLINEDILIA